MDAYETLTLIGKVLAAIYLIAIPWTLGAWVWLPGGTALFAFGSTLGLFINKPADNGNAAAMEQINNDWATQVFAAIGYDIYFVIAVVLTITLQLKWFDWQERKESERDHKAWKKRFQPPQPVDDGEYIVVRDTNDPAGSSIQDTPVRQITSSPHNSP